MNGIVKVGNNVKHMRGDTGIIKVELYGADGSPFEFRDGDSATLTIKKKISDEKPVLQKTTTDGLFVFQHEDTQDMKYGNYWYDIQVTLAEGQVLTVVGPAQYQILPDVTGGAK